MTQSPSALERAPLPPDLKDKPQRSSGGRWFWLVFLIAVAAGAYFLWPKFRPAAQGASAQPPAAAGRKGRAPGVIPVVAVRAQKGNIGLYINGLGNVIPIYTVTVKSRVDGELTKVFYNEGQLVHQGDPLMEIDVRPYQVMLEQAEGQMAKDQATLNNARVDQARYEKLLSQNAIPEQQLATQKATVASAEGSVKADQAAIDNAKLNLVYCHITAPITGRVGLRLVDPGNIVHASDSNALVVITQIDPISLIFTINEGDLPPVVQKLHAGQRLTVDALDPLLHKKLATGILETIDNQIDQTTGTIKLRARFDNKNGSLFPNQFVNPRLLVEERYGVTLVPDAAIERNSQSTYVWLVKQDQTVTVRPVETSIAEGGQTQVTSGLQPGDMVITDGVDKLQEGSKVIPRIAGESPRSSK